MTDQLRADIRQMLAGHNTLTLATIRDGAPWSATVFYASDADLNLYFVSDQRTRHAQDMIIASRVALAINADVDNWNDVRGLQIEGDASRSSDLERARAVALYLAKFASVKALFDAPVSADERTIAERLTNTDFWRVTPTFIRLIDNRRGFCFRQELRL